MSRQECGKKVPSLEDLSASDLMEMQSSKPEQSDTRQRCVHARPDRIIIYTDRDSSYTAPVSILKG
ncbi:uncharacterized protein LAESUDRAFT_213773 [Laetiporus sulphureus 93-53]|uniref:Uncharacterized protein n=1 Tax=Laetiporus sulphureus 93-53 TaxID=1314785 RepID=A0A165DWC8_9APHY|nr:uncharacterized protein LAESUDRAFT_213773 [Laetiporus sulphureus 93-53]KZT05765.1 hypothetical protein LAESUDRAFT_213773 [Laetiporus sulphureus 93-53]